MSTFDSHPKSLFWSNKNLVKPNQVALNSHKKFWFDCFLLNNKTLVYIKSFQLSQYEFVQCLFFILGGIT